MSDMDPAFCRPAEHWSDERLGVSKQLVSFTYKRMERPIEFDRCEISVTDYSPVDGLRSDFLAEATAGDACGQPVVISLRQARTPVDCVLSVALQQMMLNERSRIRIRTRSREQPLEVVIWLCNVLPEVSRYFYEFGPDEVVAWAEQQKSNGVELFRQANGQRFAQYAFSRAAKALVSLKPFDKLTAEQADRIGPLYDAICVNLAACLLKAERYDDALHVLRDCTERTDAPERGIYRRAVAHYHLKQLDEARAQIERLDYAQNRDQRELRDRIVKQQTDYERSYSSMVKKMFQ